VFLTAEEAREAVRIDFMTYGSQKELMASVLPLLAGREVRPYVPEAITRERLVSVLEAVDLSLEDLAALCSLVFNASARVGCDRHEQLGIWVDTGMESFVCTRCGQCCLKLDFHRDCTSKDVQRWQDNGRHDILAWVGEESGPDGQVNYRIWRHPNTPLYTETCPWLRRIPGDRAFVCTIQDMKPEVCLSYPGTAKHARMTGCPGLGRD